MTRIDRLVTGRIALRIVVVVLVFMGLIALVESLDAWRYSYLSANQGAWYAVMAVLVSSATWSIKVLPVTVLIGAIIALLDLQGNRELMVMKASGISIWKIVRGPIVFVVLAALIVSLLVDTIVTEVNRGILPVPRLTDTVVGARDTVWLEQNSVEGRFVVQGRRTSREAHILEDVTFFLSPGDEVSRIKADRAVLEFKQWALEGVVLLSSNQFPSRIDSYTIATDSTRADLNIRVANSTDFTFFELSRALATGMSDPVARAAASMRFAKLLALPALLVGSLLIAFAFTAGYRRQGSYITTIIYGIVLGFVVFVITEMADRAGSAGVLNPAFAAWGPAIVAIVIGLTVLLHKEDGRA